jgi:hypothetical protein
MAQEILETQLLDVPIACPFHFGSHLVPPKFDAKHRPVPLSKGQVSCSMVEDYLPNGTSLGWVQPAVKCAASLDQCPCALSQKGGIHLDDRLNYCLIR